MCVTVGPDVESPLSSNSHISGAEGLLAEPEDKELYLMCLCEQQVTAVGGSKRKKGKEIFIGFLVSCNVIALVVFIEFDCTRIFEFRPFSLLPVI